LSLTWREERRLKVFENRVLSRIFGPKRGGGWGNRGVGRLHNGELNDLFSSPAIVRVTKSRRMRSAAHVAWMGEERGVIGFWCGNLRERDQWGDPGVDGNIILGRIFRMWDVGLWTGLGWLRN
jgi:hypothetical protein